MKKLPKHVAIIMDGNGRWAKKRFFPRVLGHRAGVSSVKTAIKVCANQGVDVLTLFAFSVENNGRPVDEVRFLMQLFISTLDAEIEDLHKNNIKLNVVGDFSVFSAKMNQSIQQAENLTKDNSGLVLNIAINYSGRWDILQAVSASQKECLKKGIVNEASFQQHLCFSQWADPDLLIRTSGECRISNFMLWNLAYTELYFTDILWPDFTEESMLEAFDWYQKNERRFGLIGEQAMGVNNA